MYRLVADVFSIKGRGLVVSGRAAEGTRPKVGTTVTVHAPGRPPLQAVVLGMEVQHPPGRPPPDMDSILLRGLAKEDVPVGSEVTAN